MATVDAPNTRPGPADYLAVVRPRISLGTERRPLPDAAAELLRRVVVDLHAHRPGMFEIAFADDGNALSTAGLGIGTVVTIGSGSISDDAITDLITGEVVAIEGSFDVRSYVVARGYTKDHRLQRARRNRTFLNAKDSDIARRIAGEHGLPVGAVDPTRTAHDHVGQVNQSDWEFLRWRADALGYDFGVADGKFFFTKAANARTATRTVPLRFPETLRRFAPRISAGNLVPETEVRVWDPDKNTVVPTVVPTATVSVDLAEADPAGLARPFLPRSAPTSATPSRDPAMGNLGPGPVERGFVLCALPVAHGAGIGSVAAELASGAAERLGSTVAEAEGEAEGEPAVRPGSVIEVGGVSGEFCGRWAVTRAVHVHDGAGYITRFEISGRQERSLLGLGGRGGAGAVPNIPGVVCGVVSNIGDPQGLGRVRVVLPWLSPEFESDWAIVAHPGAGAGGGARFQPIVGDEVLVAFEFGDVRRAYVLGGLVDKRDENHLGGEPVKRSGAAASVVWRGITSPTGNRLAFHDELTPGKRPSTIASEFVLGTKGADVALVVDKVAGTLTLRCSPEPADGGPAAPGRLTIECNDGGTIDIQAGKGGVVNVGGGAQVNLTGEAAIKIESRGPVEIKGNPIKLN
ncbi:phage baseplate assembly protein V [Actinokineospora sp. 24-640]